jgi:hypothetical protein
MAAKHRGIILYTHRFFSNMSIQTIQSGDISKQLQVAHAKDTLVDGHVTGQCRRSHDHKVPRLSIIITCNAWKLIFLSLSSADIQQSLYRSQSKKTQKNCRNKLYSSTYVCRAMSLSSSVSIVTGCRCK